MKFSYTLVVLFCQGSLKLPRVWIYQVHNKVISDSQALYQAGAPVEGFEPETKGPLQGGCAIHCATQAPTYQQYDHRATTLKGNRGSYTTHSSIPPTHHTLSHSNKRGGGGGGGDQEEEEEEKEEEEGDKEEEEEAEKRRRRTRGRGGREEEKEEEEEDKEGEEEEKGKRRKGRRRREKVR
ncbi:hypothetical protein PoB_006507700 [Plakobranchus ocellatus]|uniref:Uncharacterized protein n=1 Tax=Plakobranchus ocellatus TaxID=259542 RepID=A0AAV4D321_9GAST|nr:hypothetical protein PoB_006507700 [Plakobranchus ocellatus]